MRIFVTGASGHIGSALVPELLGAGHDVVGLARSDSSAQALTATGAEVCRGALTDLDTLRSAADDADGVIHLAFDHAAMQAGDMAGAGSTDLAAVRALAEPLRGSGRPLVGTSGTALLARLNLDRPVRESDVMPGGYRVDAENAVIDLASDGVRSSVVRLPPTVHSHLDTHGFVPGIISAARTAGRSGYPGTGDNRWPATDTFDAARLYRLAVESAPAGTRLHAVDEEGIAFRDIAEAIGRHLGLPTESIPDDRLEEHFSYLSHFVTLDNPTVSTITRELLGWQPTNPGLLADLDSGHYTDSSR